MDKKTKVIIGILVIAILIIAGYLSYAYVFDFGNKKDSNSISTMNEVPKNIIESSSNNVIENEVTENQIDNTQVNNEKIENPEENKIEESNNTEIQELSDDEKALKIVKDDWGTTDGVYFKIENINGNGTYEIAVRDSNLTNELAWYTVDPKTGKFSK